MWALKGNVTQLEFLSPKHSWHPFYNEFQRAYEILFKPPKDTKEQLYKSAEYTDAIQKGFLQRIQLDDPIKERKWLEQGERAMIDWHDATSKPFAMKEAQELLPPQGPDPKRQKLEVSLLVPETQFLAQHQVMLSTHSCDVFFSSFFLSSLYPTYSFTHIPGFVFTYGFFSKPTSRCDQGVLVVRKCCIVEADNS